MANECNFKINIKIGIEQEKGTAAQRRKGIMA